LSSFEGTAYVIDIKKRGTDVTAEELKEQLDSVDLQDKILILRTGHMAELIRDKVLIQDKRPGLSINAARYLCEDKGIKMIAIDSVGVESRVSKNYDVNVYLCKQGILILVCVANLDQITKQEVFLEAFPLKIVGVEGTPCRAIIKENIQELQY
jgi:kynurenine formamidase